MLLEANKQKIEAIEILPLVYTLDHVRSCKRLLATRFHSGEDRLEPVSPRSYHGGSTSPVLSPCISMLWWI